MIIPKYKLLGLCADLNKELKLNNEIKLAFTNGYYGVHAFYKYSVLKLKSVNAIDLYSKVKNSKAIQKFERVHKANCVLGKQNDDYVIKINY